METQQSRNQSSFSPFFSGLKLESTNPVDPPDNQGGSTGGGGRSAPSPSEPEPDETEESSK